MFGKKLFMPAALVALSLTGCVVTGTVTPTGTAGSQTGSPAPIADNKNLSNKTVAEVQVSQQNLVIYKGKSTKITGTVKYTDGTVDSNVTLASDDNTVVAVNATNGEVTGLAAGKNATIRVASTLNPQRFATMVVSVKDSETVDVLATITPEKANIQKGETVKLTAQIQNSAGTSSQNGSWSSSNQMVAQVKDGIVTGIKDGKATITFTSDEKATVQATAEITVGNPAPAATPAPVKETTATTTTTVTTETNTTVKQ